MTYGISPLMLMVFSYVPLTSQEVIIKTNNIYWVYLLSSNYHKRGTLHALSNLFKQQICEVCHLNSLSGDIKY